MTREAAPVSHSPTASALCRRRASKARRRPNPASPVGTANAAAVGAPYAAAVELRVALGCQLGQQPFKSLPSPFLNAAARQSNDLK